MRSESKDSQRGEMFIWRNEFIKSSTGKCGGCDIFRDEMGVSQTAGERREEMDTSQNECQGERAETGEWLWWLPP